MHEAGLLGRNDAVVISLVGVLAYPEGVAFRVHVVVRSPGDATAPWSRVAEPGRRFGRFRRRRLEDFTRPDPSGDGSLGVEYRDNTGATCSLGRFDPMSRTTGRPSTPVLVSMRGTSHGTRKQWVVDREFWLWPLPPPEPFALVVAWPALGLQPMRRELDGAAIVAAAALAEPAWPAD